MKPVKIMQIKVISTSIIFLLLLNVSHVDSNLSQAEIPDIKAEVSALLKYWPENGPEINFMITGIGNGYSSPAVTSGRIYVTGEIEDTGFLFAYDHGGSLIWKTAYGKEWIDKFPGSRAQPTIAGDHIYVCSGMGSISCFNLNDGMKIWSVDMVDDLKGELAYYGYSSKLLIDGHFLFCAPGGANTNVAALNRFTGETIWATKGRSEAAGQGNPILVKLPERLLMITASEYSLMGIDAGTGIVLWSYELAELGEIPCNQPLYHNGHIYFISGPGNGAVKLELSPDGSTIREVWKNPEMDTYFGGFVKIGQYIYGAGEQRRVWKSIDTATGEITDQLDFYKGATITANGMLFLYNEKG